MLLWWCLKEIGLFIPKYPMLHGDDCQCDQGLTVNEVTKTKR